MTNMEGLRQYVQRRAEAVPASEAGLLVDGAASRWQGRARHHLRNTALAFGLAVVMSAGIVLVQLWVHTHHLAGLPQPMTSGVSVQSLPDEVVEIGAIDHGSVVLAPFRIRDQSLLPAQPAWTVAPDTALIITPTFTSSGQCTTTSIRLVNPVTGQDRKVPVTLNDCYSPALVLPDHTVLLVGGPSIVRYDWAAGKIVQALLDLSPSMAFDMVASSDGRWIYGIGVDTNGGSYLEKFDLQSGRVAAHVGFSIDAAGPMAALTQLALSADGRVLYVDAGHAFAIFDAATLELVHPVNFPAAQAIAPPSWLFPSIADAEAKEFGVVGSAIALHPANRWAAVLGPVGYAGVWVISLQGNPHLIGHFRAGQNFRGIAVSRDGSLLYLLEDYAYGHDLMVLDPTNGRVLKEFNIGALDPHDQNSRDFSGIAAVLPAR